MGYSYGHIFETCVYSLTRVPFLVMVISVSPIIVNCLRRGCGSKRKTRMHLVIGGGYVSIEKLVPLWQILFVQYHRLCGTKTSYLSVFE